MSPRGKGLKDEGTRTQAVLAGGIAGLTARFVIAPLDVIKIRLQLQPRTGHGNNNNNNNNNNNINQKSATAVGQSHTAPYRNTVATIRHILATEGVRAFWKGNIPAEGLYVSYSAVQFTAYRSAGLALRSVPAEYRLLPSAAETLICGAAAGALATAATYPLDLLRTRFAAQGADRVYASLRRAVGDITRDEGWRGFYRGLVPALGQIVPYMGLFFCIYEGVRPAFTALDLPWGSGDASAGVVASVVAKTSVYPLDLVRKRIQVQGPTRPRYAHKSSIPEYTGGVVRTLAHIVRADGVRGLYRGLGIGLLKSAPASVVTLYVYERALETLRSLDEGRCDGENGI